MGVVCRKLSAKTWPKLGAGGAGQQGIVPDSLSANNKNYNKQ